MLDRDALEALIAPMIAAGQSQNEIARSLGLEKSALSRWRQTGGAGFAQVAVVAERLNVPVTQLWRGAVPKKYAYPVRAAKGAPALKSPIAMALDTAYVRGYAAGQFRELASAAEDIARRAHIAADRMATMTQPDATPSGALVEGEAAEHLAGQPVPARPRRRKPRAS